MNPKKTLQKKIYSAKRENDINMTDKDGTSVITFSAAAFDFCLSKVLMHFIATIQMCSLHRQRR